MSMKGIRILLAAGGALACSLALAAPASAAIFTVDDLTDAHDSEFPGPFTDGICDAAGADTCTLRAAIEEANNTVVGSDTIDISVAGTIDSSTLGQMIVSEVTEINGNAGGTTLDAGDADRVLITQGSAVTLNDLTLTGGSVTDSDGAGIFSTTALLTLNRVQVSGNTLNSASGGYAGGGIATQQSSNALVLTDSTVSGNSITGISGLGGGIRSVGPLTLDRSTVSGNDATPASAGRGGGIDVNPGSAVQVTITNSTISGNDAGSSDGGGLFAGPNATPVTITGSTIASNTTTGNGGGIRTFGTTTSEGTIYALNQATVLNDNCGTGFSGSPESNIDTGAGCGFGTSNGNKENVSPAALGLGALAANGGPTMTHAIATGSAAHNAAVDCSGLTADQRGVARPQSGSCDIGAFELEPPPPTGGGGSTTTAPPPPKKCKKGRKLKKGKCVKKKRKKKR
jgi:hypothetical protein